MPSATELRELLLTPSQAAGIDSGGGNTAAAVLIALFESGGDLHAVFTKRHDGLRRHAGEISFPGGREDPADRDLVETALREAEEEVGLPREQVDLIGALPPVGTFVTGYRVSPFVGLISAGRAWTLQPTEVEQVLELPLAALVAGFERRRLVRHGVPFRTNTYTVDGQMIWGATARIVESLLDRLAPLRATSGPST